MRCYRETEMWCLDWRFACREMDDVKLFGVVDFKDYYKVAKKTSHSSDLR